ncbi:Signal transduction histidine kinase [Actinomyces ruminicola]|uniref:histidine kinase n=1 Tax=Actinomyces ruminicola TaxID=332524 RepID=A0A1H0FF68_9ACTO|nr:histidine kinase [Actinomyces ruminicola]SDN93039.1 Signal transduction histidine kinase [Actinomyces ruminicola]
MLTVLFALVALLSFSLVTTWGAHPVYLANALTALVVAAAQPFRHRRPVASGMVVYLAMVAYVALLRVTPVNLGLSPVIAAVPTALHTLTRWAPDRRWGAAGLLAALMGALVNPQTVYSVNPHTAGMFNYPPFGFALACVLVVTATYLLALRARAAAESLERTVTEAARLAAARAVSTERLAIARELHDLVGHGLTVVKVQADTGLALGTAAAARESLTAVRDASAAALASTRELVALLRDTTTEGALAPVADLTGMPELVERARATGLEIEAAVPTAAELASWNDSWTALQRLTLNRVIAEGLTNAAKHGGGSARIAVSADDGACTVRISNPLPGDESTTAGGGEYRHEYGHGLTGMAERLRLAGGRLEAGPRDDAGRSFLLEAVFPVSLPAQNSPTDQEC